MFLFVRQGDGGAERRAARKSKGKKKKKSVEEGDADILCCGISRSMGLSLLVLLLASSQAVVYLDFIIAYFEGGSS